jgi:hypothetical protein
LPEYPWPGAPTTAVSGLLGLGDHHILERTSMPRIHVPGQSLPPAVPAHPPEPEGPIPRPPAQSPPATRVGLAGDTPVFIRRLGDDLWSGPIRDYEHRPGDRVPALDPREKVSAWAVVAELLRVPCDSPLVRVTTESGRQIFLTGNAGLVTLGDDAEVQPIAPGEVVVGRTRLPVVRPVLPAGSNLPLDRDRGRLAGIYISEGHAPPSQPGLVCISVADEGRARQVLDLITRLGQHPYRNRGSVNFTGHATCAWLLDHFGHLSHAKRVPAWALAQGRPFVEGLVEGYMGGDGCLWADTNGAVQVTAVSVSPAIRDGMVDLLATLDVFCTFFDAPRSHLKPEWRDGFGFRIISSDLAKLDRWFLYDDREEKVRKLRRARYRASMFDQVPVSSWGRKFLYAGFVGRPPQHFYQAANRGAVSKERISGCLGTYGIWGRSDVSWDRVMAVEPAPPEPGLYGLAVEGAWPFAAGHGLLVQDGRSPDPAMPGELF